MKKSTPLHRGKISGGQFRPYDECAEIWQWDLESLEGSHVALTLEPRKMKRSISANAYWWGVVLPAIKRAFNEQRTFDFEVDTQMTHDIMKVQFLGEIKTHLNGKEITIPKPSRNLEPETFGRLIEYGVGFAAEYLGVNVPPPPYHQPTANHAKKYQQ